MRLFLNGVAASAGAGLTYLRNVVPCLSTFNDLETTVALSPAMHAELGELPGISYVDWPPANALRRFWREQTILPDLIRKSGTEVLISAGNFALRNSPVPQILLSGNALYTSRDFYRDLRRRHAYGMWLGTHARGVLAKRSVRWADLTVAPSQTFGRELRDRSGGNVISIFHGFDRDEFFRDSAALPAVIAEKIAAADKALRLLFVSHYNYYRNFETLLRAVAILKDELRPRKVRLFLTCKLHFQDNPGGYKSEFARSVVRELGIGDEVVELGSVPYSSLHHLYRACDLYVTPACAETFAHPLVEAMASGLPVVASDLAVHKEICRDAAVYFPRFSPESLVESVMRVAESTKIQQQLCDSGLERAREFSWKRHVEQLLIHAEMLKQPVAGVLSLPAA